MTFLASFNAFVADVVLSVESFRAGVDTVVLVTVGAFIAIQAVSKIFTSALKTFLIFAFLARFSFNVEGASFIAFLDTFSVFEGKSLDAGSTDFSISTVLTGVLARLASFAVVIHEGSSRASLDTVAFIKVSISIAFSTSLQSSIAFLAVVVKTVLAFAVDLEEFISAGVNTVLAFKKFRSFAFVASVRADAVNAVLLAV